MKRILLIIFININILLLNSCNNIQKESNPFQVEAIYEYDKDFHAYFNQTFKQKLIPKTKYFVIPISSCDQCVDSALFKAATNSFNWNIVIVGVTEDSIRKIYIDKITSQYKTFNDSLSHLWEYAVGIGLPSLLKVNEKNTVFSKREFSYGSWSNFKE